MSWANNVVPTWLIDSMWAQLLQEHVADDGLFRGLRIGEPVNGDAMTWRPGDVTYVDGQFHGGTERDPWGPS